MLNFAQRNLKVFFRQKSAVFFSLLGVLIVIGLYLLFLGDVWISGMEGVPEARSLMSSWIIAGVVSITPVTTAMGAFQTMVDDRVNGSSRDFYAAPVKRWKLVGGYVLSAYLVALLMSLLALVLGECYIVSCGGSLPGPGELTKILLILPVSTLSSSAMVFFLVTFFSSNSAFATASTVLGTLIGFITGIYLPVGNLPEAVQWVVKLFPASHAGALLRQAMLVSPMEVSFTGAPEAMLTEFKSLMGVTYAYGDYTAGPALHLLVLAGSGALFFLLAVWKVSRKRKKAG